MSKLDENAKLRILADATMVPNRQVSATTMRAVLSVIAGYEFRTITYRAIAERVSRSKGNAELAVGALVRQGVVICHYHREVNTNSYAVDWESLARTRSEEPLMLRPRGGRVATSNNAGAVYQRAWRRARKVAAASLAEVGAHQ